MKKEEILSKAQNASGLGVVARETDVQIKVKRDNVRVMLTIPCDVTELYFEAHDRSTGKRVEDWMDYYGETEERDFEEDLSRFLGIMRDCPIRMDPRKDLVEYYEDEWRYFFGRTPDGMLR